MFIKVNKEKSTEKIDGVIVIEKSDQSAATWSFNPSGCMSLSRVSIFGVVLKDSMRVTEDWGKPQRCASVL